MKSFKCFLFALAFGFSPHARAFIDPAQVAMLSSIAASTKATLGTLKSTLELVEVGEDMRKALSEREDDADGITELFEEIAPSHEELNDTPDSDSSLAQYRQRLEEIDQPLDRLGGIKWDYQYLKRRSQRDPRRIGSMARLATRAIRLGKRIARLLPKSHEEHTASNTEIIKNQNYAIGKAVMDIRYEVRTMNERQAKSNAEATLNTVSALEQMEEHEVDREFYRSRR